MFQDTFDDGTMLCIFELNHKCEEPRICQTEK